MPWFKVDDKFHANVKVTRIPRANRWSAIGLWTIAGAWSADQLTDGFIPLHQFEELGAHVADAEQLVAAQLWSVADDGYHFNNWGKYQPSAVDVTEKLERLAEARSLAGKKGASARWNKPDSKMANEWQSEIANASSQTMAIATPDPSRPVPTLSIQADGKRITSDFAITPEMREWFTSQQLQPVNIQTATEKFIDYYLSQEGSRGVRADWVATWRNWMRKAKEYLPLNAGVDPWAGKEHLGFDTHEAPIEDPNPLAPITHSANQPEDESDLF